MSAPTSKACTKCGRVFPLTTGYKPHKLTTDGRQSQCRECDSARSKAYTQALYVLRNRHYDEFLNILHAEKSRTGVA